MPWINSSSRLVWLIVEVLEKVHFKMYTLLVCQERDGVQLGGGKLIAWERDWPSGTKR